MTHPTQPKHVYLSGLEGLGMIRFTAVIPHGKGTREVAVNVAPETILRIADALRATAPVAGACPCDGKYGKYDHREKFLVGHAIWHVERPEEPMPCIDHSAIIDVACDEPKRITAAPGAWASSATVQAWRSENGLEPADKPSETKLASGEVINVRRRRREAIEGVLHDAGLNFDEEQHEALCTAFVLALEAT